MIKNTTNSLVNLANVTRRFEVTEVHKDGEKNPIPTFKFDTANGQPLTVTGQLAYNVCNFLNFDFMGRKAGVAKAKMFERAEGLEIDWSAYGAKDAKDFYVKMLAIDKSQFEKYALASKRFMNDDLTPKIPCLEGATIGKLVKLNQYYPALRKNFNDESQLDDVVLQTIARDFEEGTINLFMTDDKFDEAIKKSFKTVEEPKAEKPKAEESKAEKPKAEEPKAEEPKAEEPKAEEPKAEAKAEEPKAEAKPKDLINSDSVMFTALNKMKVAMKLYDEIKGMEIKTDRERKLDSIIKAFVKATEYTLEIFE